MVFLHSNGVSTSRAVRIYKTYGEDTVEKVRTDPYRLAKDIPGIGFKTADQIAQKMGIPVDSLIRACTGLSHVLLEATGEGHCALPVGFLKDEAGKLLLVNEEIVKTALERTLAAGDLVRETIGDQELVFLPQLKRAEEGIAARIKALAAAPPNYPPIDVEKALAWCQQKTGKELAPSQQAALRQALASRSLVLTGGPGVGKTTPARPENVAARYKEKLAEAQNAPQMRDRSFLSTLLSSDWFEALIFAALTLVAWLAMALMYFVYSVQRAVLLVCWVLSPVLFATLAIRPISNLGLGHVLRIIGIILWPLGLALAATFTDGLIDAATDQNFLAGSSAFGWLGYGLQNLLAVTVIAIWIIFSTILAPLLIQRLVAGSAGPAMVLTAASSLVTETGLPALFGTSTRSRFTPLQSQLASRTDEISQPPRSPPFVEPLISPPPNRAWQPRPSDPTGDQQARAIVERLKSS